MSVWGRTPPTAHTGSESALELQSDHGIVLVGGTDYGLLALARLGAGFAAPVQPQPKPKPPVKPTPQPTVKPLSLDRPKLNRRTGGAVLTFRVGAPGVLAVKVTGPRGSRSPPGA